MGFERAGEEIEQADPQLVASGSRDFVVTFADGAIEASAKAVSAILARGQPVYGISTGFGKLASVRIEAADEKARRGDTIPLPPALAALLRRKERSIRVSRRLRPCNWSPGPISMAEAAAMSVTPG